MFGCVMRCAWCLCSVICWGTGAEDSIRPYKATWRAQCVHCVEPLVRNQAGKWEPFETSPELFLKLPVSQSDSTAYPEPTSATPEPIKVDGLPPVDYLAFPPDFAAKLLSALPHDMVDPDHYAARGRECRRLAAAVTDSSIELIHLDMANRYDILAREASKRRSQSLASVE